MNTIYLIKSYGANTNYYKVGITSNIERRHKEYKASNPGCEFISITRTYDKTKYRLETAIHLEIKSYGFEFETNENIETEWFAVEPNTEMDIKLTEKGLATFKKCKNRKIIMCKA